MYGVTFIQIPSSEPLELQHFNHNNTETNHSVVSREKQNKDLAKAPEKELNR